MLEKGIQVLGIAGQNLKGIQNYVNAEGIKIPILSDEKRLVIKQYEIFVPIKWDSFRIAIPSTYILDASHTIIYSYIGDSQFDRPALDEILNKVNGLGTTAQEDLPGSNNDSTAVFVHTMKETFSDIALSTQTIDRSVKNNLAAVAELEDQFAQNTAALSQFFTVFEQMETKISLYSESISEVVKESVEIIEDNEQASAHMAQTLLLLKELVNLTQTVGSISGTISGIAAQTKILALNASIEAARAGEQGKGFSVVANEVGKLATASADASQRISLQLEGIESKINSSFSSFKDFDGLMQQINSKVSSQNTELKSVSEGILSIRSESGELAAGLKGITHQQEKQQKKMQSIKQHEQTISSEIAGINQDIEQNNMLLEEIESRVQ